MSHPGKFRALLATARIANVPSVVSNVWLGIAISIVSFSNFEGLKWNPILLVIFSGVCLYLAGNFLNDWYDREWDQKNRPERALPRGLFSPTFYLITAIALGLSGIILAALAHILAAVVALTIILLIVTYTVVHKRESWSVIPMGLCRAMLVYLGLAPLIGRWGLLDLTNFRTISAELLVAGIGAGALFFHIVGLSMSARQESKPVDSKRSPVPTLMFAMAFLLPASLIFPTTVAQWMTHVTSRHHFRIDPIFPLGGGIVYLSWLLASHSIFRKPIPRFVSALLAGIPLVDWIILSAIGTSTLNDPNRDGEAAFTFAMMCLLIPPAAFVLGRLLQRVAPAT